MSVEMIHRALCEDDAALFRKVIAENPEMKARINEPVGPFDSPLVHHVRSRAMLDALLEAGADINARSRWWAGGFGLLDSASDDLAGYAIERGAAVDVHSAARLGLLNRLEELIGRDRSLVNARGGDGQTPLHFARNVEVAKFLLAHGADPDARDIDHESTPAQWMISERQEVARYLIEAGCGTDVFMAAALGDRALAERHLNADPRCLAQRVDDESFPMKNKKAGGTIYQWTLGFHVSPHQVARRFGHESLFEFLMERSSEVVRLINYCWLGDQMQAQALLVRQSNVGEVLSLSERRQIAHAARNNNLVAVRLMVECGWPVEARAQHGGTALHWAAWHGNVPMVQALLGANAPLELTDTDFQATPLGWAIHGSENGWHRETGDYRGVVKGLLTAGAKVPERGIPAELSE